VRFLVGLTHYQLQQYTQAKKIWSTLAEEASGNAYGRALLFLIADTLYSEQAYDQAINYYQKILREFTKDPEIAPAYLRMAQIHFKQGDDHKAMMTYMQFIQLSPKQKKNKKLIKMKDAIAADTSDMDANSEKLVRFYTRDMNQPIQNKLLQASVFSRNQLPANQILKYETAQIYSNSRKTELPWLSLITWSPVMVIQPQKPKRDLQSWRFTVQDKNNSMLYLQEGKPPLPKKIIWDGKRRDGEWVRIGEPFYYSMHLIGRDGKTISTDSELKRVNSLAYRQQRELNIQLLSELVFERSEIRTFSELGTSLLKESCSAVIGAMGSKIYVTVRAHEEASGKSQANMIKLFIRKRLQLADQDVEVAVETVPVNIVERITLVVR
jgi:outer membrane protein assembly factor BamD (BamD/ComL family)